VLGDCGGGLKAAWGRFSFDDENGLIQLFYEEFFGRFVASWFGSCKSGRPFSWRIEALGEQRIDEALYVQGLRRVK
jgi:hypothetical protein